MNTANRRYVFGLGILVLAVMLAGTFYLLTQKPFTSAQSDFESYRLLGERVEADFNEYPLKEIENDYTITDSLKDGVDIQFANKVEDGAGPDTTLQTARSGALAQVESSSEGVSEPAPNSLSLAFPEDLNEPLAISLPGGKVITVTHNVEEGYSRSLLTNGASEVPQPENELRPDGNESSPAEPTYIKYTSGDSRINTYYAYQKDQAAGYRNLKHWTIFDSGDGTEEQSYTFTNAHITTNDKGEAEVRYLPDNFQSNEEIKNEVGQDLWERAKATLGSDLNNDIENQPADFVIPAPYIIDSLGNLTTYEWQINETNDTLTVSIDTNSYNYPIALDPTLQFTAPGVSNAGDVIDGEGEEDRFGSSVTVGDFNNDGKEDLAVGAYYYSSGAGGVYIFYGGSSVTHLGESDKADVTITGETNSYFGWSLTAGDFNNDGKDDLAVGAHIYSSGTGSAYIFYGGSLGANLIAGSDEDATIAGEISSHLGYSLTTGDFNADGQDDLAVGAYFYSSGTGRTYIFYGDGSIPTTAATADVIITGEVGSQFGSSLTTGDFNNDGKDDLAVGTVSYSASTGRAYIFYGGSMVSENATGADITLTGETTGNSFGYSLTTGDFNNDGKDDLAVGASTYSLGSYTYEGRVYIFYNDGSIPTTAATADVIITGEVGSRFGSSLTTGDFNGDEKEDLVAGAYNYSSITGRAYIFYGDGSIPTTAATADVIITGETYSRVGWSLTAVDFNNDGQEDLVVGAYGYSSNTGRTYIFYSQSGQVNLNSHITGEGTSDYFGGAMTVGDFNNDGRDDLAVGAYKDATNTGKVYIFYGDGDIPTGAGSADVIITGQASGNFFGYSLTTGDFNNDGTDDLVVGAHGYSSFAGRTYIFYGDGSIPTTAATADVTITGESSSQFGSSLTTGDFNNDGTDDLVVGAATYSTQTGRVYIFYNDGSIPTTAATADVIITGESTNDYFGTSLLVHDLDSDGEDDLVVGAYFYGLGGGRVYLFYNDGSIPTTAATADVIITGDGYPTDFGYSLAVGDFDQDGEDDLVVGAEDGQGVGNGKIFIFSLDSSIPTTSASADITISGNGNYKSFGNDVLVADFNNDGKDDLVVGAYGFYIGTFSGQAFVYYGGTFTASMEAATNSSLMIEGDSDDDEFGLSLVSGDMNNDGKDDLIVGAPGYNNGGDTGRVYFYQTREDYAWEIQRSDSSDGLRVDLLAGYELKITGEPTSAQFATAIEMADLNNDGKEDLILGAFAYNSGQGRVYIFYNDGGYSTRAGSADVILSGETGSWFGYSLTTGDFNADGKDDLVVGANGYSTNTGRAYIFYGGSMVSENATGADVILTGETTNSSFGWSLTAGDFNSDGKDDLVVGSWGYDVGTNDGRAYIFYGGSLVSENASGADVILTGETSDNYFGRTLTAGDFNADGKDDLVVAATLYSVGSFTFDGRAYIFYGGSLVSENASGADITLTGETSGNFFGASLTMVDFNADGKDDLVVGANGYSTNTGRAYIFYGGSMVSENATGADVILTGETTNSSFGGSLTAGDFNSDGRDDIAVSAVGYDVGSNTNEGRTYILYSTSTPGSRNASTADIILTGEGTSNNYGASLFAGDINNDGTDDILVGATGFNSSQGRLYMYTTNDRVITAVEDSALELGQGFTTGDFNNDGKTDLAVSADAYNSYQGRAYVFYGGNRASSTAGADVVLTGEATSNYFGYPLKTGDLNSDGIDDLVVGAGGYSSDTGRAYIFHGGSMTTEGAASADVIITGETSTNNFSGDFEIGDFNKDGKDDLAVSSSWYSSAQGRAYVFYGGSIVTENASGADVIYTGEAGPGYGFGWDIETGDFNADGTEDLAVSGVYYGDPTYRGRVYIFHGGSMSSSNASAADEIITGENTAGRFGSHMKTGDYNDDGKDDLAIGAYYYNTDVGRVYVFYNSSLTTSGAESADLIIDGESSGDYLGGVGNIVSGDINADGRDDLILGSGFHDSQIGRIYIFYGESIRSTGVENANVVIDGESNLGYGAGAGAEVGLADMDNNGVVDLIVAASAYGPVEYDGRIYILMSEASAEHVSTMKINGTVKFNGSVKFH